MVVNGCFCSLQTNVLEGGREGGRERGWACRGGEENAQVGGWDLRLRCEVKPKERSDDEPFFLCVCVLLFRCLLMRRR